MTFLMFALALYGLGTMAYQIAGIAIEATRFIRKTDKAMETLHVPATPINRKKVAA